MKSAINIHHDFYKTFRLMTREELGDILMAIMEYDMLGEKTVFEDRMVSSCFERLVEYTDRCRENYENLCKKRKEAAAKRWAKTENEEANGA